MPVGILGPVWIWMENPRWQTKIVIVKAIVVIAKGVKVVNSKWKCCCKCQLWEKKMVHILALLPTTGESEVLLLPQKLFMLLSSTRARCYCFSERWHDQRTQMCLQQVYGGRMRESHCKRGSVHFIVWLTKNKDLVMCDTPTNKSNNLVSCQKQLIDNKLLKKYRARSKSFFCQSHNDITHGAKQKQCTHSGCTKPVKKFWLCSTHGPSRK